VYQTLFYIPREVFGLPLFGFGLLLALWAIGSAALLAWLVRRHGFGAETRGYLPVLALMGAVIAFVLPAISQSEGLPIRGYGTMLLAAVIVGVGLAVHRARCMGVDQEMVLSMAFWMFIGGIVGARAFYVIEYWNHFRYAPNPLLAVLKINEGGLVVYGSLIGGGLAMVVFVRKHRLPFLALGDLIMPSLVLGQAIGRIGCFLNGCCFGGLCLLPWAVTFPAAATADRDSPPHKQQIVLGQVYGIFVAADGRTGEELDRSPIVAAVEADSPAAAQGLTAGQRIVRIDGRATDTLGEAQDALVSGFFAGQPLSLVTETGTYSLEPLPGTRDRSRPVHPTQIYSAIDAGLLCLFLLAYYPFRRRDGELVALALTIHPIMRFLLEVIRTDESSIFGTGLSISQNVSLLLLAFACGLWVYLWRQPRGSVLPPSASETAAAAAAR
jgi:phosphatidylglycerol---prolipoprotein diacylglyceryl transferase